jgi:hypothetical protein
MNVDYNKIKMGSTCSHSDYVNNTDIQTGEGLFNFKKSVGCLNLLKFFILEKKCLWRY